MGRGENMDQILPPIVIDDSGATSFSMTAGSINFSNSVADILWPPEKLPVKWSGWHPTKHKRKNRYKSDKDQPQNFCTHNVSGMPSRPLIGELWADTSSNVVYQYDGSSFVPLGSVVSQAATVR